MAKQVRLRRGTTVQHATFTGAEGEVTFDTSKKVLVVHDGVTAGGKPIDGYLKLNPGSPLTAQTIAGPLDIVGGDADTYSMAVLNQASFNQVLINADAQIKRIYLMQEGLVYASNMNINFQTFAGKRITLLVMWFSAVRVICSAHTSSCGSFATPQIELWDFPRDGSSWARRLLLPSTPIRPRCCVCGRLVSMRLMSLLTILWNHDEHAGKPQSH